MQIFISENEGDLSNEKMKTVCRLTKFLVSNYTKLKWDRNQI